MKSSPPGSAAALFLLLFLPPSAPAQMIQGTVTSDGGIPLPDVTVTLFDGVFQQTETFVTDESGDFRFIELQPGEYILSVDRPGHASVVSTPLELGPGDTLVHRIEVDAPSLEELGERFELAEARDAFLRRVAAVCGDPDGDTGGAVLAGAVRDTLSGMAVPGVEVFLRWTSPGDEEVRTVARTSADGSYVICDAPSGVEVVLGVEGLQDSGDLLVVTLDPGTAHILSIPVDASEGEEPGQVAGRVVEHETGRPVSNAEVRLRDADVAPVTNTHGYFVLRDMPPGRYLLSVQHLGYGEQERSFVVLPGRVHELEVRLVTEAIELEPIEVTVRPSSWLYFMDGLQFRMRQGFGHFILQEDMEMRGPNVPIGLLLDGLPRVEWRRRRGFDAVLYIRQGTRNCIPAVWIDGIEIRIPIWGPDEPRTTDVEAVEVYTWPGSIPAEFGGGVECGAVVISTKRW